MTGEGLPAFWGFIAVRITGIDEATIVIPPPIGTPI
jgi:hypothetical protein